ncbi:DUF6712 family protein [Arcicella sp. LKC2W]|uniref:DUF6712 family protein n=1 Tax=Arcicella sp. LKC2W TaxID=2984198 RepID=UPI002B2163C8|nr:DUF6712 family protein [Arcicella sp. LKC2W]MEA5459105.1 DUF6712 family protein [Arcicella sp. LKC2W]
MILDFSTYITEADIHKHIRSTTTFEPAQLVPNIQDAAETYLYNILSPEFLEKIIDGTEEDTTVQGWTKISLINYAGAIYADKGLVNLSADGIFENSDANSKPVRLEVLQNFKNACLKSANNKVDLLLKYLEKNATKIVPKKFEIWMDSEAYTVFTKLPIRTLTDFQQYLYIHNSRAAFLALKPYLQTALDTDIQPLLTRVQALINSQEVEKVSLTNNLKRALCHFAYAYGINDLAIVLGDGVYTSNNTGANRQTASYITAEQARIDNNRQEKLQTAKAICAEVNNALISLQDNAQTVVAYQNEANTASYYTGCYE